MILKKFLVLLLFTTSTILSQTPVPISSIKQNNSSGVPVGLGQTYTVSGIVTSSNQFGSNGPGNIQDSSAGISVYGSAFVSKVSIGDSVTITGKLDQFNGLCQINFSLGGASIVNHGPGTLPEPEVVTIAQINNQQWNGFEEFESKLIRVNSVTISGSGNFSGGSSGNNYNITDSTGTMQIRIDESVDLVGTPIPSGKIDIIGVLGQFDNSAPHSTGYQLYPRYITDLVYESLPIILPPVTAAEIDTSSFTVYFNTANNGNTEVKYGQTTELELGDIIIDEDTTFHRVEITGLQPGTLYYYKAFSTNSVGTSESDLRSVYTLSNDTTTGTINVYFNFSVDTSIALPGNNANGNTNLVEKLINRINSAVHSIDLALYSFDLPAVADALVLAKNRGVKVRVVYDSRDDQNSIKTLIANGIKISKRPPESSSFRGIMHNKFFVFDARDTIPDNDWVWTGSWNITTLETGWKNNSLEINDPAIASAYLLEFEEMWGSSADDPNPSSAKFSSFKTDNTPHSFTVGGRDVKLYFSPTDGTTSKIINAINTADHSIYFTQYAFTRSDLNGAIFSRFNAGANDVRGLIDQVNTTGSQWSSLSSYAEMYKTTSPTSHHKYAMVDAQYEDSDPTVITGSHNWSNAAENDNDENTLIIIDPLIANQFLQEFKKRYNEAGGTGTFIFPVSVDDGVITEMNYHLFQNYPNPFNPVTTIKFEIPFSQKIELKVFDMLGREVKTLFSGIAPAGVMAIDFKADDLPSGMYVYTISAGNFTASKKLMLLK